jgi:hypothetical protein
LYLQLGAARIDEIITARARMPKPRGRARDHDASQTQPDFRPKTDLKWPRRCG